MNEKAANNPKWVIVTGLIGGIIGFVLFTWLFIRNLNNENTLLRVGLGFFVALNSVHIFLAIKRLKQLRK